MPGMHGPHELIEFLAAALLSVGGGLILVDAVLGRRAAIRGVTVGNAAQRAATPRPGAAMIGSRSTIGEVRRAETLIAVGLSAGASLRYT